MNWLNAMHGIVETNDFETFPESSASQCGEALHWFRSLARKYDDS